MTKRQCKRKATAALEADPEVQDSESWAHGDFALVSTDAVRYRVDSMSLCWAR